jgi:hypothetical protein
VSDLARLYRGFREQTIWDIQHANLLGLMLAISFIIMVISLFLLFSDFNKLGVLVILFSSSFFTLILWLHYIPAKRFFDLIRVFDKGTLKWGVVKEHARNYTLRFISDEYGEFYLSYFPEESAFAFYRLWIISDSYSKYIDGEKRVMWMRPTILDTILDIDPPEPSEDIPLRSVERVRSLRKISLEEHADGNRIMAQVDDKYLRSDAQDLVRVLKILKKIDENFEDDKISEFNISSWEWTYDPFDN